MNDELLDLACEKFREAEDASTRVIPLSGVRWQDLSALERDRIRELIRPVVEVLLTQEVKDGVSNAIVGTHGWDAMADATADAAQTEREECAKIADSYERDGTYLAGRSPRDSSEHSYQNGWAKASGKIAQRIRERA